MRYLIWVLALISMPAAAADQFDLECEGSTTQTEDGAQKSQVPENVGIIVDLRSLQYCYKPCKKVLPIKDVYADRIVFRSYSAIEPGVHVDFLAQVDRKSGVYTYVADTKRPRFRKTATAANCEVAAFTGFPATKF